MKKVFALLLSVILVVACFSACGEPLSNDKDYDTEMFGDVEIWHTYGEISKLKVGVYEVLIPEYNGKDISRVSPGYLEVTECYHNPVSPSINDGTIYTEIRVYYSTGILASPLIKTNIIQEGS